MLDKVPSMSNERLSISDLSDKVLRGSKKALRKLVETKAANNQNLIVGDEHGNFKSVPAKEILKNLPE